MTNLSPLLPYWNLGLLNVFVQGGSWNLLLAPSIMRATSFPRSVFLYGGWLPYCQHSGMTIFPLGSTESSTWTFLGGASSSFPWDGLSFLLSPTWASLPDFSVSSDAAGALGYGAISGHDWFVGNWSRFSTPSVHSLQGTFSCSRGCLALGPQMGHWMGGVPSGQYGSSQRSKLRHLKGPQHDGTSPLLIPYSSPQFFCLYRILYTWAGQFYCWCLILFWLPAFPLFSTTCSSCGHTDSTISAGAASRDWTEKCQFYWANGLAPSTRQVYGSAQRQFLEFCSQDIPSDLSHPLLPASEQNLDALLCPLGGSPSSFFC